MRRRRRDHDDDDASSDAVGASAPAKRQRVSLACDSCRRAKAKCDGGYPCNTCTAQGKACMYSHTSRKRGVPSGYIKSIESSLAWLFDKFPGSEDALHNHLTGKNKSGGRQRQTPRDGVARRLHQRWNRSCIPRDISNNLSGSGERPGTPLPDAEFQSSKSPTNGLSSELGHSPEEISEVPEIVRDEIHVRSAGHPHASSSNSPQCLFLPPRWEGLIDVFFRYTFCWFPLIDRDQLMETASRYLPEGLRMDLNESSALDAQLWAVLAVASFQDETTARANQGSGFCPDQIFAVACQFSSSNDGNYELPLLRAFLLQSIILLGQQETVEAWALIGKTLRLTLGITPGPAACYLGRLGGEKEAIDGQISELFAALFIIDTLASLCAGHVDIATSTFLSTSSKCFPSSLLADTTPDSVPCPNPGFDREQHPTTQDPTTPIAVFKQLYTFCRLWSLHHSAKQGHIAGQRLTSQELLQNLSPQFSFCNSLLRETSTLEIPSMFLLQLMFLTISLDLASEPQLALLLNLLELIETYTRTPDILSIPPLTIALMNIVHRHNHTEGMSTSDKLRWDVALKALKEVWRTEMPRTDSHSTRVPTNPLSCPSSRPAAVIQVSVGADLSSSNARNGPGKRNIGSLPEGTEKLAARPIEQNSCLPYSSMPPPPFGSSTTRRLDLPDQVSAHDNEHGVPGHDDCTSLQEPIDYNLILEELASVQYADPIEADLRFMANLGFEPGQDLGEMFPRDFAS
ncbi:hypothetical protein FDECE_10478 [Fusarium decemcellulare]|nr:hypothetical protein FDECE_10478 [Fusarium decemcellulare]